MAWSGQPLDSLTDDVEFVRRIHQRTEKANEIIASWVLLHRGSIISQSGPEGKAVLPESALTDLPKIKDQYEQALGCEVAFGLGNCLSEAVKAVAVALIKGKQKVVFWSNSEVLPVEPPKEDPLLKAAPQKGRFAEPRKEESFVPPEGPQTKDPPKPEMPEPMEAEDQAQANEDIADILNSYATPPKVNQPQVDLNALRQQTGEILKKIKQLVPNVEQLQSQYPELYQGYLLLAQAFLELSSKKMQKSESKDEGKDEDDEAELVERDIKDFKDTDFATEDEIVERYAALGTAPPPVLMVGDVVVDGKKRLAAAKKRGDTRVQVYLSKAGFQLGVGLSKLPVGTVWGGRMKQIDPQSGQPKFKMLLSGMIMSSKTGLPVSSTRPE